MELIATSDPTVFIEEQRVGYIRYQNIITRRRWEVWGTCDARANCWVGAVLEDGTLIETLEEAHAFVAAYNNQPNKLDCPVTPEFNGCCPFTFVELEPAA